MQGPQPGRAHEQQGAAEPANEAAPLGAQRPEEAAQQPQGAPAGAAPAAAGDALHNLLIGLLRDALLTHRCSGAAPVTARH